MSLKSYLWKDKLNNYSADIGVVVNYFTNYQNNSERLILVDTTKLSLRLALLSDYVSEVLLVDGSEKPDKEMMIACKDVGARYLHFGKELSYSEAYNKGWSEVQTPFIALMANDIIPHPIDVFRKLREAMDDTSIGCAFPYFASNRLGGDEVQRLSFGGRGEKNCQPSTMTLNLNLFRRTVLEQIKGIDERFTAGYAEPIIINKLSDLGYEIRLVGAARVIHYDRLTKSLGQSKIGNQAFKADNALWFSLFPELANRRCIANIDLSNPTFSKTLLLRFLWKLSMSLPSKRLRTFFQSIIMYLEPILTSKDG